MLFPPEPSISRIRDLGEEVVRGNLFSHLVREIILRILFGFEFVFGIVK